jgi:hypothetical protein
MKRNGGWSSKENPMNTSLSIEDPLAGQEVTIVITLAAGEQPRDERPALVSVGVAGQPPVTKSGTLGQTAALINQAWSAFGVQSQLAAVPENTGQPDEETAETPETATPASKAAVPQPDLSFLF